MAKRFFTIAANGTKKKTNDDRQNHLVAYLTIPSKKK